MTYVALAAIFAGLFTFNGVGTFSMYKKRDALGFRVLMLAFIAATAMAVLVERGVL